MHLKPLSIPTNVIKEVILMDLLNSELLLGAEIATWVLERRSVSTNVIMVVIHVVVDLLTPIRRRDTKIKNRLFSIQDSPL